MNIKGLVITIDYLIRMLIRRNVTDKVATKWTKAVCVNSIWETEIGWGEQNVI